MTLQQLELLKQLSLFSDDDFIKSTKFYLIKAISKMDIATLELILDDEASYQDTTKEIFLNKLNLIFEEHKNDGDTELLYYSGTCSADYKLCDNCGKSGFRFVGNYSNNYLDLIFEIEEDNIKDIYDCSKFKANVELDDLKYSASIYINEDDKVTFNKTPEYWAKVNAANAAYLEIISSPTKILDFEEVCYWVDKHYFTNNKIGNYSIFEPEMKWYNFSRLYDDLNEIKIFINTNLQEIIKANDSLKQVITEDEVIDWVIKQEVIIKAATIELKHRYKKRGDYYVADMSNFINLYGEVFDQTFNYIEAFQKHNDELLDKHRIYTFNECVNLDNKREYNENDIDLFSLSFHIQTRKKLEHQGIVIQFYLDKKGGNGVINEIE